MVFFGCCCRLTAAVCAGDYIDFLHQLSRKVTAEEDNKPVPFTPQVQKLIRYGPNPLMRERTLPPR